MAVACRLQRNLFPLSVGKVLYPSIWTLKSDVNKSGAQYKSPLLSITRNSRYAASPFVDRIKEQYDYEIMKHPPEWTYVQRLLPLERIPEVKVKSEYPSGWVPPKQEALNLPFFVTRTKNHMLPIYLKLTFRGTRRISLIRKIEGDIWLLNDEIKGMLEKKYNRVIPTRVHEFTKAVEVKGDYVVDLHNWAYSKGF